MDAELFAQLMESVREIDEMPLYEGKKNVGRNIKTLVGEGRPQKQAVDIAMKKAKKNKKKK